MMGDAKPDTLEVLRRGLKRRCPRCGLGKLFDRWHELRERCDECGLVLEARAGDTWGLMYVTTAALTGCLVVGMLLYRPASLLLGRAGLLILIGLALVWSLPYRKGLAVAIDFLVEGRID